MGGVHEATWMSGRRLEVQFISMKKKRFFYIFNFITHKHNPVYTKTHVGVIRKQSLSLEVFIFFLMHFSFWSHITRELFLAAELLQTSLCLYCLSNYRRGSEKSDQAQTQREALNQRKAVEERAECGAALMDSSVKGARVFQISSSTKRLKTSRKAFNCCIFDLCWILLNDGLTHSRCRSWGKPHGSVWWASCKSRCRPSAGRSAAAPKPRSCAAPPAEARPPAGVCSSSPKRSEGSPPTDAFRQD